MMHAAAALLLTFVVAAACAAPSAAFAAWSLDTCRSDAVCATRFGVPAASGALSAYDVARFAEMLSMIVARQPDSDEVGAVDALASCVGNDSAPGCAVAQLLWLGVLRVEVRRLCADNEEWILGHGCECMDGKKCVVDCTQAAIDNLWPFSLSVGILGVFMLIILVWMLRKSQEMERVSRERNAQTLVMHYTLQAHLYLADSTPAVATSAAQTGAYAL
jgi:hypothetical protein